MLEEDGEPIHPVIPDWGTMRIQDYKFPDVSESDIMDMSKGDYLSKAIALVQLSWFFAHMVTRAIQGLFVSELEIITAAYTVVAVIIYAVWWKKPLCCGRHVMVQAIRNQPSDTSFIEMHERPSDVFDIRRARDMLFFSYTPVDLIPLKRVPTLFTAAEPDEEPGFFMMAALAFFNVVFGAIHFIPWFTGAPFPTVAERMLWRVSACVMIASKGIFVDFVLAIHDPKTFKITALLAKVSMLIGIPFYLIARSLLITLSFTALRALPEGAYKDVSWSSLIPHIG